MLLFSPNSYVEVLMRDVMISRKGAFGRHLRPEDAFLMNGISALIKEAPEESPPLLPWEDTVHSPAPNRTLLLHAGLLTSHFPPPELGGKNSVVHTLPVCAILLSH